MATQRQGSHGNLRLIFASLLLATLTFVVGCASNQSPPDQLLSEAQMRIQTAEEAEAGRQAPAALRSAQQQLVNARQAMRADDHALATQELEKAIANADFALIKSRSEKMQRAAEEIQQTLDTLRRELQSAS